MQTAAWRWAAAIARDCRCEGSPGVHLWKRQIKPVFHKLLPCLPLYRQVLSAVRKSDFAVGFKTLAFRQTARGSTASTQQAASGSLCSFCAFSAVGPEGERPSPRKNRRVLLVLRLGPPSSGSVRASISRGRGKPDLVARSRLAEEETAVQLLRASCCAEIEAAKEDPEALLRIARETAESEVEPWIAKCRVRKPLSPKQAPLGGKRKLERLSKDPPSVFGFSRRNWWRT